MKTKGKLEAEISEAIIKFEQEYMGRGPEETKTYLIDDMILVGGILLLTPGFLTDLFGFTLMVPATRALMKNFVRTWMKHYVDKGQIRIHRY